MSACEFVGSNVDFYVPLVLKRADLFLAADLFLECLELEITGRVALQKKLGKKLPLQGFYLQDFYTI